MALPQHTLVVVGIDYPNRRGPVRRFEIAMCVPGEHVELRPEPDNPADPCAVAVFSARGVQIGYLQAERCGRIFAMIRKGRQVSAIFQGFDRFRGYIRVAYDGEAAILPPTKAIRDEPDFDPDPIWEDDGSQI